MKTVGIRLDEELIEEIGGYAEQVRAEQGTDTSWSDAARALLRAGLETKQRARRKR